MRKTEKWIGICAAALGIIIAAMCLFSLLKFNGTVPSEYSYICLAANVVGLLGALIIQKNNIAGAAVMAAGLIVALYFGFPWQSLPAVLYIISVVMATVPVKTEDKRDKEVIQ